METLCHTRPAVPVRRICDALSIPRATLYRRLQPRTSTAADRPRRRHPRALDHDERSAVIEALHSPEYIDRAPREVYAALLSLGIYLASIRTMYRILEKLNESPERRRGHKRGHHAMPQLEAFAPNEVWTWDITKVAGVAPGVFYFVHVVIDLFSRMIVGWMVASTENASLAGQLLTKTMKEHGIEEGTLTVHSDRGAPMTAGSMATLLATLGVTQSLSRPRVSNDNPFVESFFKTAKYQPDYPGRFASAEHVRGWFAQLFDWYCHSHHHEGLALFTPAEVFEGRVAEVAAVRQAALDQAYAEHPERFVRGRPVVRMPPTRAHINLRRDDHQPAHPPTKHEVIPTGPHHQPAH